MATYFSEIQNTSICNVCIFQLIDCFLSITYAYIGATGHEDKLVLLNVYMANKCQLQTKTQTRTADVFAALSRCTLSLLKDVSGNNNNTNCTLNKGAIPD